MSGYALVIRRDGGRVPQELLTALSRVLARRGGTPHLWPDESGVGVAASLLDVGDERLTSPYARVAGRWTVAGQVRVDDRAALLARLRREGVAVEAEADDVHLFGLAWSRWGRATPERVLGDYSVAVVDEETRDVLLVRDRFGVRLLYFALARDALVVSNMLEAVLAAPGVSRALDADAVADFLAAGLNENPESTTFRDVSRVAPGQMGVWHVGAPAVQRVRWWTVPAPAEVRGVAAEEHVERFRRALEAAVSDRLRAPRVSVMMSGGLDSTALAALAARALGPGRVRAVTVAGAPGESPEELERARLVARQCGLEHVVLDRAEVRYMSGLEEGPELIWVEPVDAPELAFWVTHLRSCAGGSAVLLYGEDPDALLRPPSLARLLRTVPLPLLLTDLVRALLGRSRPHLGVRQSLRGSLRRSPPSADPPWLAPALRAGRVRRLRRAAPPGHRRRPEAVAALTDVLWQSVFEPLDAGVHGVPLEARFPYLDERVVAAAFRAPAIPWAQRKRLLREAMRGVLPDSVRLAPKRGLPGFFETQLARYQETAPVFTPSAALGEFVDLTRLPPSLEGLSTNAALAALRLRLLDLWLRHEDRW